MGKDRNPEPRPADRNRGLESGQSAAGPHRQSIPKHLGKACPIPDSQRNSGGGLHEATKDRRNPVEVGFAIQSSEVRERSIEGMRAEVAHDFSQLTDWNPISLDSVPNTGGLSLTLEFVQHPCRNVEGHNLNPCHCEG